MDFLKNERTRKKLLIALAVVGVLMVVGYVFLFHVNRFHVDVQLNGQSQDTVDVGKPYVDPGAVALFRGTMVNPKGFPVNVLDENNVDTARLGTYTVNYSARYKRWGANAKRVVTVVDREAPTICLYHENDVHIASGGHYVEDGYSAWDNYDGDLTDQVVVSGSVDTKHSGTYTLTYEVSDSSGNIGMASREITVTPKSEPNPVQSGEKIIYLTFDDGPGPYTEKLLKVLKNYNVKATFFVINSDYAHLIRNIAEDGHSIGIHSASHKYRKIYSSSEAFFDDLYKMRQVIEEYSGKKTTLMRFPGGSSNTVSSFNPGIMTKLTKTATEKGFQYFDWNVDSGDAGGANSSDQVFNNVIHGIKNQKMPVVLQHDVKNFSVDAVERIIVWGLKNGYTFRALDEASPVCHHDVSN